VSGSASPRVWKRAIRHGQILLVDDVLFDSKRVGDVVLVEATPAGIRNWRVCMHWLKDVEQIPCWRGCLLVRNDREAAATSLPCAAGICLRFLVGAFRTGCLNREQWAGTTKSQRAGG